MVGRGPVRRKLVVALATGAVTLRFSFAQDGKVWRVGYLATRSRSTPAQPDVYYDAFLQAMRELGYREGVNLSVEWRFAEGRLERMQPLAEDLVRLRPDVLVTHATQPARALQRASGTIPIVSSSLADPVGSGMAASLARPGGNVTGLSNISIDITSKRIELLVAMVPKLSRLGVLINRGNIATVGVLKGIEEYGRRASIKVVAADARTSDGIASAFGMLKRERVDAIVIANDPYYLGEARRIAELAAANRMPSMSPYWEIPEVGGLMSYGLDIAENYRRAAIYVDKILKGTKPGDLPIEQPTTIRLVINRKAAAALGLQVPPDMALRADRLID